MYVPDSALIQEPDDGTDPNDGRKKSICVPDDGAPVSGPGPSSHVVINTTKV